MRKSGVTRTRKLIGLAFMTLSLLVGGLVSLPGSTSTVSAAACAEEPTSTTGRASQTVTIEEAGTYTIWSRLKAPDANPVEYTAYVDGQCFVVGQNSLPASTLTWVDYQNGQTTNKVTVSLAAGTHEFVMTAGSENLELDRVILLTDNCTPSGTGDNCLTDSTDPTVSLTGPGAGATISGNTTLTATASDNDAIDYVEFYNGSTLLGSDSSQPYSFDWDTTTVANGAHQLTAWAYDLSGNVATSSSVNVTVDNPAPVDASITSFTATPATITQGGNATLSWEVAQGDSCSINQSIGSVANTGTQVVSPAATTTYTLSCQGQNGGSSDSATATVTVNPAPVDASITSFTATPATITQGGNATLSWEVAQGDSCSINQSIGSVANTGTQVVSPAATTTYTLSCQGQNGGSSDSATATVTVNPAPVDSDGDGVTDEVEDGGPNNGDANHDGTPDSQQPSVVTLVNEKTGKYNVVTATGECSQFQNATSPNSTQISNLHGIWSFRIACSSAGGSADVKIYLDDMYGTDQWRVLKLNASLQNSLDISDRATLTTAQLGGNSVTVLSYRLTDGGDLDEDGSADGVITDPVAVQSVTTPEDDEEQPLDGGVVTDDESAEGELAQTGASATVYTIAGTMMIVSAMGIKLLLSRRA